MGRHGGELTLPTGVRQHEQSLFQTVHLEERDGLVMRQWGGEVRSCLDALAAIAGGTACACSSLRSMMFPPTGRSEFGDSRCCQCEFFAALSLPPLGGEKKKKKKKKKKS